MPSDPSKDYYFMLRDTGDTESIIVEYGFLDSPLDDPTQLKNNYEAYAEAVVRALVNYIGATYIPVAGSDYYVVQNTLLLLMNHLCYNVYTEYLHFF